MKKAALALVTAATIGVSALVAPSPAQAWRGGGWGAGLAAGLIGAAVVGGKASRAHASGPGYGYFRGAGFGVFLGAGFWAFTRVAPPPHRGRTPPPPTH